MNLRARGAHGRIAAEGSLELGVLPNGASTISTPAWIAGVRRRSRPRERGGQGLRRDACRGGSRKCSARGRRARRGGARLRGASGPHRPARLLRISRYAGDTTDPARAKFYGDAQERVTEIASDLLFFELELNRLATPRSRPRWHAASRTTGLARGIRKEKPHQLADELEQLFLEKSVSASPPGTAFSTRP